MTFKPGAPGRPVGATSRSVAKFSKTMDKHGFDIAEELLEHYNRAMQEQEHFTAVNILFNMAKYVYPTLKSIDNHESSPSDGMTPEQRLEAMKQYVAALELELKK